MANDDLDKFLRAENNSTISLEQSKEFANTKRQIRDICVDLSTNSKDYKPERTIFSIESYTSLAIKLDRILYSEISNYIYSLEASERGTFATNIEKLLLYSLDKNNSANEDSRKMIIKIYDHFQLALHQIESTNNILANSIEDAKENLQEQIKGVEKEYISILGIFASIILAFVGGITFSTSILQNISSVSIYRLLLVIDFLAFVLINIIYILIKFIFAINEKDCCIFNINALNKINLVIAIIIVFSWLLNINRVPDFLSELLFWCN